MRKIVLILPFLFLFACNEKVEKATDLKDINQENKTIEYPEENLQDKLISFYSPYVKFPLDLSTTVGNENPEDPKFEFRGNKIPKDLEFYFKQTPWYWDGMDYSFYAVYRFDLQENVIALITRAPGEYWESKLVIFLFDKKQNKIIKGLEVAETFGDAGDVFILESVLKKENKNFIIEISQEECHPISEDLDNVDCVDSLKIYQINGFDFQKTESRRVTKN